MNTRAFRKMPIGISHKKESLERNPMMFSGRGLSTSRLHGLGNPAFEVGDFFEGKFGDRSFGALL